MLFEIYHFLIQCGSICWNYAFWRFLFLVIKRKLKLSELTNPVLMQFCYEFIFSTFIAIWWISTRLFNLLPNQNEKNICRKPYIVILFVVHCERWLLKMCSLYALNVNNYLWFSYMLHHQLLYHINSRFHPFLYKFLGGVTFTRCYCMCIRYYRFVCDIFYVYFVKCAAKI